MEETVSSVSMRQVPPPSGFSSTWSVHIIIIVIRRGGEGEGEGEGWKGYGGGVRMERGTGIMVTFLFPGGMEVCRHF